MNKVIIVLLLIVAAVTAIVVILVDSGDDSGDDIDEEEISKTCADTNADGTEENFDCSGHTNSLAVNPSSIVCEGDECQDTECCTKPRPTCADTNADGTDVNFDCSGNTNGLARAPENIRCSGEVCTEAECCILEPHLQSHSELGQCSNATAYQFHYPNTDYNNGQPFSGPCPRRSCNFCCGVTAQKPDGNMKNYGQHCREWQCGGGTGDSGDHIKMETAGLDKKENWTDCLR
jgi:hypothetical protein